MVRTIVNFVLFQVCWFASILGAAQGYPIVGPVVVGAAVIGQFLWRRGRVTEFALYGAAALAGVVFDTGLEQIGALSFEEQADALRIGVPLWMIGLWVSFAATLPQSLAWLRSRLGLSVVLGAVGGPLAYWGGQSFGAVTLGSESISTPLAVGLVAAEYAIATPLLVLISNRVLDPLPQKVTRPAAE